MSPLALLPLLTTPYSSSNYFSLIALFIFPPFRYYNIGNLIHFRLSHWKRSSSTTSPTSPTPSPISSRTLLLPLKSSPSLPRAPTHAYHTPHSFKRHPSSHSPVETSQKTHFLLPLLPRPQSPQKVWRKFCRG